jgi:hypothetical protein
MALGRSSIVRVEFFGPLRFPSGFVNRAFVEELILLRPCRLRRTGVSFAKASAPWSCEVRGDR